ncbi:MAG: hypothetical protein L3J94_07360 [Gammaproteobacteria bacterium]|nr:hypothetical protein [Gammaproteobacteria bacterium]
MKSNVLLDVAELALSHLGDKSNVTYVNINDLYDEYISGGALCRIPVSKEYFRSALKTMFPIYKNVRKHTNDFKISIKSAYFVCDELSLTLRPIEHIMQRKVELCLA